MTIKDDSAEVVHVAETRVSETAVKRVYVAPESSPWGTVEDLTEGGGGGNFDGGAFSMAGA